MLKMRFVRDGCGSKWSGGHGALGDGVFDVFDGEIWFFIYALWLLLLVVLVFILLRNGIRKLRFFVAHHTIAR